MRRTLLLVSLTFALANAANAADLPAQSRIGAIFDERPQVIIATPRPARRAPLWPDYQTTISRIAAVQPETPGYYGQRNDYYYRSYYGTSPWTIFSRLPYACHFHSYC